MPKRTRDHQSWLIEKLSDPRRAAEYLTAARKDSREMFLEALRDVAQVHQMTKVAREAGLTRESLYRATSPEIGNPTLDTFDKVLDVLGIEYEFRAKGAVGAVASGSPLLINGNETRHLIPKAAQPEPPKELSHYWSGAGAFTFLCDVPKTSGTGISPTLDQQGWGPTIPGGMLQQASQQQSIS